MKILAKSSLGYLIRKLTIFYEDGININYFRKRRRLKKIGINYSRYKLFDKKWLFDSNIQTVIDIGANIGEFTVIFAELFHGARIYAFEPLPDCYKQLIERTQNINNVNSFNIGIGSKKGKLSIHHSSWHPASSFREMSPLHKESYPHSAEQHEIQVSIDTLDGVLKPELLNKNILIKIDVQGFEDEVIKGGLKTFERAKIVIVECSFQELYENEPMFHGVYFLLKSLGYEYRGSLKQSVNKNDDSYLQADCIFIKT